MVRCRVRGPEAPMPSPCDLRHNPLDIFTPSGIMHFLGEQGILERIMRR